MDRKVKNNFGMTARNYTHNERLKSFLLHANYYLGDEIKGKYS